ncbi:MAG: ATP-binding protein [Calditrichaeota bacterium]|nr:ATP-binding protein [Calditrichota bacterium]
MSEIAPESSINTSRKKIPLEARKMLIRAFLGIPSVADDQKLNDVLNELPTDIRGSIKKRDTSTAHINSILAACFNYPNGIDEFFKALEIFESDNSISLIKAKNLWNDIEKQLKESTEESASYFWNESDPFEDNRRQTYQSNFLYNIRGTIARYWRMTVLTGLALPSLIPIFFILNKWFSELFSNQTNFKELWSGLKVLNPLWLLLFVFALVLTRNSRIVRTINRWILGDQSFLLNKQRLFRGPRPYDRGDYGNLPGREIEISDCVEAICQKRFYIIEGESGCGKSSLISAGVVPELEKNFRVVRARLANQPFRRLDAALLNKPFQMDTDDYDSERLLNTFKTIADSKSEADASAKPLLICIDQFEELFVTVPDQQREHFLETLKTAFKDHPIYLVFVIRSDFRDLLDKLVRKIDPERLLFSLGNYYELKAFSPEKAESVVKQLLAPLKEYHSFDQNLVEAFSSMLVNELLRPPRDERLNREDTKTVLPVELQTIGFMLEGTDARNLNIERYKSRGGKTGLYQDYIEDAKTYVYRSTGIPAEQSLRMLRCMISDGGNKIIKTIEQLSAESASSVAEVKDVMQAFADKLLVCPLPENELKTGETGQSNRIAYELMHESLVHVLKEAPEPVLQKMRDAHERLKFWQQRQTAKNVTDENGNVQWFRRFRQWFAMPIPLVEALQLLRFADLPDYRKMLVRNIRGFFARLLVPVSIICLLIALSYTTQYQLYCVTSNSLWFSKLSPQSISNMIHNDDNTSSMGYLWLKQLTVLGKGAMALAVAGELTSERYRSYALQAVAEGYGQLGDPALAASVMDSARVAAAKIKDEWHRSYALQAVAEGYGQLGDPALAASGLEIARAEA